MNDEIIEIDISEYDEYSPKKGFLCNKCKKLMIRVSLWDQVAYGVGAKWFAMFKCPECDRLYRLIMSKQIKNWSIGNIEIRLSKE